MRWGGIWRGGWIHFTWKDHWKSTLVLVQWCVSFTKSCIIWKLHCHSQNKSSNLYNRSKQLWDITLGCINVKKYVLQRLLRLISSLVNCLVNKMILHFPVHIKYLEILLEELLICHRLFCVSQPCLWLFKHHPHSHHSIMDWTTTHFK